MLLIATSLLAAVAVGLQIFLLFQLDFSRTQQVSSEAQSRCPPGSRTWYGYTQKAHSVQRGSGNDQHLHAVRGFVMVVSVGYAAGRQSERKGSAKSGRMS